MVRRKLQFTWPLWAKSAEGDDGDLQKGIPWPDPRFTDNGDGRVTDNLTGLMWTQDAQEISGTMSWSAALTTCNVLYFAGYDDWRLPNVRELQSLIDYGKHDGLPIDHSFIYEPVWHWLPTTDAHYHDFAWYVGMDDGHADHRSKHNTGSVWPVCGGE